MAGPLTVAALRDHDLYICADICVRAIEPVVSCLSRADTAYGGFFRVWDALNELHVILRERAGSQIILETPIHAMFFGAAALIVTARCCADNAVTMESQWIPVLQQMGLNAPFDRLANPCLANDVSECIRGAIAAINVESLRADK